MVRGALLAGLLGAAACRDPDVILLSVDTLRVDHVRAFNPDAPSATPAIDALAADGVVYTDAWSPISVTGPSFCSLMTGEEPGRHGVVLNVFRGGARLPARATTLAERLQDAGWDTGAFVSGFTLRKALGLGQGFDTYDRPLESRRRRGDETVDLALGWLREHRGERFLWVHLFDPHGPLRGLEGMAPAAPRWERDAGRAGRIPAYQRIDGISDPAFYASRYAAAVSFADRQVGRVLDALRAEGRYDEALIVFHADHGESFTERDLWFDHGTTAYAEQLHVPLIVKYPDNRGAGTRVDRPVSLVDVAPTVLAVLGLDPLPGADGRPLDVAEHAVWTGESSHCKANLNLPCRPRGPGGKMFSARDARWTLVRRSLAEGVRYELYDRRADPGERHPVRGVAPPAALREAVDALAAERAAMHLPQPPTETLPPEELEALRALGYVEPEAPAAGPSSPGEPAPAAAP